MTNGAAENTHLEIERRFLIAKPDESILMSLSGADYTDIEQTYLVGEPGTTERVRRRGKEGRYVCTHTIKTRLSSMTHSETESEITHEEYCQLLTRRDIGRNKILKRRYTLPHAGLVFEIDLFPFWEKQAIMEVELTSENTQVSLPEAIHILREITGNRAYSNAALAAAIPAEDK